MSEARRCEPEVRLTGFLGALLEAVEDVDRFLEPCEIDDTICSLGVSDTKFRNSGTDGLHWLPIGRLKAFLKAPQLATDLLPDRAREGLQVRLRSSHKPNLTRSSLHWHTNTCIPACDLSSSRSHLVEIRRHRIGRDIALDEGLADAVGQDEGQGAADDFLVLGDRVHQRCGRGQAAGDIG